jgi:PAS domain S-box-containing protein
MQTITSAPAPPVERHRRQPLHVLAGVLALSALYFLTAQAGYQYLSSSNISMVWLPSGIALGALIRFGIRWWPGITLGSFVFSLSVHAPSWVSAGTAISNTLQAVAGWWLLRRYTGFVSPFLGRIELLRFLALGAGLGPLLGACTALPFASVGENWDLRGYVAGWLSWWLGDALGVVLMTPLVLAVTGGPIQLTRRQWAEAAGVAGWVVACALSIPLLRGQDGEAVMPLVFLLLPPLVWAAFSFGSRGTTIILFLCATTFLWDATHESWFMNLVAGSSRHWALNLALLITSLTTLLMMVVVTEHRGAEERLREAGVRLQESEERLRLALEAAQMGTWTWEITDNTVDFSAEAKELFGLPPGECAQGLEVCQRRIHPDDRAAIERTFREAALGAMPSFCVEHRLVNGSPEVRWIECRGKVFRDNWGKPLRLVGTMGDVTQRKKAEADLLALHHKMTEAQRLEGIGVLAGGVAHDFNNWLTPILGNASLCRAELPAGSPLSRYLRVIETASLRASELCTQLLAYAGKSRVVLTSVDVSKLVQDTLQLLRTSLSKRAELQLNLTRDLPPVKADAAQIRQIVMNLVTNASEAVGDHHGVIVLATGVRHCRRADFNGARFGADSPEGLYVCLEVSDTGCGMEPEALAKIFEPFFTTKFTGRGLGLAAVSGIVRSHKAALKVRSELGRGTQFTLLLPVDGDAAAPSSTRSVPSTRFAGTALVVDDEDMVRDVVAAMLQRAGLSVLATSNGVGALEEFDRPGRSIDFVLLDLTMPRMDGVAVCNELLRRRPETKIILMSGYGEEEALARLANPAVVRFLKKPFSSEQLMETLANLPGVSLSETETILEP